MQATDAKRAKLGAGHIALLATAWLTGLVLFSRTIALFLTANSLATVSTQYSLEVPKAIQLAETADLLMQRLRAADVGEFVVDGSNDRLIVLRIQSTKTRIVRPIVSVTETKEIGSLGLSDDEAAQLTRLVEDFPILHELTVLDESEAPPVREPQDLFKRGLGFACLGAALAVLGLIVIFRRS